MLNVVDVCLIYKKIGNGSFGDVYIGYDINNNEIAAKVEKNNKNKRITIEYAIYKALYEAGCRMGIPKIYNFIKTQDYNIMTMELLGQNLDELKSLYGPLSIQTVSNLAFQIITLLEQLHFAKFIHRDIKPNNFLIGKPPFHNLVHIMDFGLSKSYISSGQHIPLRTDRSLIGTARYASLNMHNGIEPSRRDDLESVGYMLVYLAKESLPWQGIKKTLKQTQIEQIGEIKKQTPIEIICKDLTPNFIQYLYYCRNLQFTETPNYDLLRSLFNFDKNHTYEWS
jgi:serine/threonine protein kinase